MGNKSKRGKAYDVGYGRPPKQHRFQKGKSGNPRGINGQTESRVPDLRLLLQLALNAKIPHGERGDLGTHAAAGIERLVAQFAAGDRHARRDVFALAEKFGVDLTAGHGAGVVTAALAAEDEAIVKDFLLRHGIEPEQNADTESSSDTERKKTAQERSS